MDPPAERRTNAPDFTRTRLVARILLIVSVLATLLPAIRILVRSRVPEVAALQRGVEDDALLEVGRLLVLLSFGVVGYVIALRRPHNRIGWLMMGIGLSVGGQATVEALYGLLRPPPAVSGVAFVVHGVLAAIALSLALFVVLLFPDGHLPSPRWRIPAWGTGVVLATNTIVNVFASTGGVDQPNPLFVAAIADMRGNLRDLHLVGPADPLSVVGALGILSVMVSPLFRWRAATGIQRSQLKWIALAGMLWIVAVSIGFSPRAGGGYGALSLFPAAIGIAILRNRLFDIDFVINRAVLYGLVAIVMVAAFEVLAIGMERLITQVWSVQFALVQPIAAVAVVPAFRPLERKMRPLVDRMLPATETLALFFADIVASTERLSAVGDAAWREILARYYAVIRSELHRHGGTEIGTAGDGVFATFTDAPPAARCAIAMSRAVHELDLRLRVGLHLGDCNMRGEEPAGINVHLAARIMSAASPDTVLISEPCRDALSGAGLVVEELGPRILKGIPGEVRLYHLLAYGS